MKQAQLVFLLDEIDAEARFKKRINSADTNQIATTFSFYRFGFPVGVPLMVNFCPGFIPPGTAKTNGMVYKMIK